jgi:hypothetical protein
MNKERMVLYLEFARECAIKNIEIINNLCAAVKGTIGEADMTADYIWGNCTLDELLAKIENDKEANG